MVGIWVPIWQLASGDKSHKESHEEQKTQGQSKTEVNKPSNEEQSDQEKGKTWKRAWLAATLLGSAMVARGEIGLLIIEIGHNETPYVSDEGFYTGIWAILLNTIIGPVSVGLLVRFYAHELKGGIGEYSVLHCLSRVIILVDTVRYRHFVRRLHMDWKDMAVHNKMSRESGMAKLGFDISD